MAEGRTEGDPAAILVGGAFSAVGAARNLAKHGVPVYVVDHELCVTRFSRHVKHFFKAPPTSRESEFVDFLLELASEPGLGGAVLFPSEDERVRILSQHRERFSRYYRVTTPPWDEVKYLYDKRLTYRMAEEFGLPIPETRNPRNVDEILSANLDFPLVLKPAISAHLSTLTKKKAYRANDVRELANLYAMMAAIMDPSEILVQELIPGRAENLFSFAGFFKEGVTVAGFSARRPRQHPMEFGRASTFVETVDIPQLATLSEQFLKGIRYSGLAEVEFMYDAKHARFEFLEVNPRLWGWHSIAVRAGLDLPYLAYADAIGQQATVAPLPKDVKWVRLLTDLPVALLEILGGRLTIREYAESLSGDVEFAVLSLHDPLPCVADVFLFPYYITHRGF